LEEILNLSEQKNKLYRPIASLNGTEHDKKNNTKSLEINLRT